jgi:hypothetical protein
MSARAFWLLFIHVIHASIPAFIRSGVEFAIISSIADAGARYNTKNLLTAHLTREFEERIVSDGFCALHYTSQP